MALCRQGEEEMAISLEDQPDRPDGGRVAIEIGATTVIAEEVAGRGLRPTRAGSPARTQVRSGRPAPTL
jgi:hypothetical protein